MTAEPLRGADDVLRRVEPAYRAALHDLDDVRDPRSSLLFCDTARKILVMDRLIRRLDPAFRLERATRVLDVGVGAGRVAAMLGALGAGHITGLDDFGDGDAASVPAGLAAMGVDPITHDLTRMPWPLADGAYDLVVSFNTLEHLHGGHRPVMAEIRRVLVPGGVCVLGMPNALALYKRLYVLAGRTNLPRWDVWWSQVPWRGHVREAAPGELRRTLAAAGFAPTDEIGLDTELPERLGRAYPLYAAAVAVAPAQLGEVLVCAGRRT